MFLLPILTLKDNGGFAVAIEFARSVAAAGERITIVSSSYHGAEPLDDPQNAGLEFVVAPHFFGGRLGALAVFFLYAVTLSLLYRPRIIYTHIATTLIPNFSCQPSVMIAQDLEYRFYTGPLRWFAKRVFAGAIKRSRLIVTSLWLARFFRRQGCDILFSADVGVSRRYCTKESVNNSKEREFDVLLIAKRGAHKRRAEVLALAHLLAKRGRTVRLVDQAQDEQTPIAEPGVLISGAVSSEAMRDLYRLSRVFVSVSRFEGFGLTPLEALLQGCRVVTTPTPSTAKLIHPNLVVIAGSNELMVRLTAAIEASIDDVRGMRVASEDRKFATHLPFMEDWSYGASAAYLMIS